MFRSNSDWSDMFWNSFPKSVWSGKQGSPIGLAGCGIWLFFAVIFGIWAENRGGKQELQLQAGAGFCVFIGLGCGFHEGNRVGFTWTHKFLLTSAKTTSWQKRTFCVYSCVRFQVMNSNGSVPCQVLSNVYVVGNFFLQVNLIFT